VARRVPGGRVGVVFAGGELRERGRALLKRFTQPVRGHRGAKGSLLNRGAIAVIPQCRDDARTRSARRGGARVRSPGINTLAGRVG